MRAAAGAARLVATQTQCDEAALREGMLCPGVFLSRRQDQEGEGDGQVTRDPNNVKHVCIGKSWNPRRFER